MDSYQIVGIISIVVLLVVMAPAALRMNSARGTTLRNMAIWLALFVGIVALYRFAG